MRKAEVKIGLRVRVKKKTKDPDFPEFVIGGATGTITDFNPEDSEVEIAFDQNYLDSMPAKLVALCEEKKLCMARCQFTTRQVEVFPEDEKPATSDSGN